MKLSEWAARQGVHYQTAWRWWKQGILPVPARQLSTGTILVEVPGSPVGAGGRTVVYARGSSHDQRADLDRQVSRVMACTTAQRLPVEEVVTEVGSGLNGRRPKLQRLLGDPQVTVLVVEHRDRLARFGSSSSRPRSPRRAPDCGGRRRRDHRRPRPRHDRGADQLLRPAVRAAGGTQPGAAGVDRRQAERLMGARR
jgi:hypothetical protein